MVVTEIEVEAVDATVGPAALAVVLTTASDVLCVEVRLSDTVDVSAARLVAVLVAQVCGEGPAMYGRPTLPRVGS